MRVTRTGRDAFRVELDSEEELRAEHRTNLAVGGLRLPTDEKVAPFTPLSVTLALAGGGEATVRATVVATPPGALALQVEGNPESLLATLLAAPALEPDEAEPDQSLWDRIRSSTHTERLLLAPKADRSERAVLLQDKEPQILLMLLKNPRLTIDEVARIARSPHLSHQVVEVIAKAGPWLASNDVKVALVRNPKTPVQFALRILPLLPDAEVRSLAKGSATSMALRQAALKRVQEG